MTTTRETQDQRRTAAIEAYGVLDGPPRQALVSLVELAARAAGVDYAEVNLFTAETQHSVATAGIGPDSPKLEMSRDDALCNTTLEAERPFLVSDVQTHPVFAANTFAQLHGVHFYGSHPLRTPSGIVVGTLCVFETETRPVTSDAAQMLATLADRVVDVLELELASRRLGEANARLNTANARLEHFAGQVSHDLKNPLTSVSLSLESLELDVADPDLLDTLARARRGVDRMTGMIDDLLAFASLGAAPGDDLVDLGVELGAALDDLTARLASRTVLVGDLPVVRGDAAQLRSVLMNLVDNAAKFTDDGRDPEIEVGSRVVAGRLRVEVRDRGRGIPVDGQERIFAPFTRLDKTVEGAGIGLATCRRIVEAHGGSVGVEERDGGGSVFWFELPAT